MFARFIIPIVPIATALTWDLLFESRNTWIQRFPLFGYGIGTLVILSFIISPLYRSGYMSRDAIGIWQETGIAEERNFYKDLGSTRLKYDLNAFKDFRVAFYGAQAHFIYYLRPKYALESSTGLTDYQLARTKIDKRGKIGHEKTASFEYLKSKNIDIVMADIHPELKLSSNLIYRWNEVDLHWKWMFQLNINYLKKNKENISEINPHLDNLLAKKIQNLLDNSNFTSN